MQPAQHRDGYAIFVRCCELSSETPAREFASIIDTLDGFLGREDFFPSPYGGAIYRRGIDEALESARALAVGLGAAGISAAIGMAWGSFQRTVNVQDWNAAALPLNQAARLAFCDAAPGHVLATPHVWETAGGRVKFSDMRDCVVKEVKYFYHAIESPDFNPSLASRARPDAIPETRDASIVLWDIVKYSAKDADEQAELAQSLAQKATTVLHIFSAGHENYSPTGDGGFALFDTGLQALPFAVQLGKYAASKGITIRTGITHGEVAFAGRGPVGPGVLRADKVSSKAPHNGIAILADVWNTLDSVSRGEWRTTEIDPNILELEAVTAIPPPQQGADIARSLPTREKECQYLERLIQNIEDEARLYSPLAGFATIRPELKLKPWIKNQALEPLIRHQSRRHDAPEQAPGGKYGDILAAFSVVDRAALLGAPGSGKSTTLRKLALDLAGKALKDPAAPLPILASLGNWLGDQPLAQFLAEETPEIGWAAEALGKAKRLVLLLDGLNEVPTAKRADKAAGIRSFCDKLVKLNPRTAIVGSCRREDYVGDLDLGFDTLTLEPLSPQQIRTVLRQWVTDLGKSPEVAEKMFWQLAGDARLEGVLKTWLAAGASEESFWTVSQPNDEKQAYAKTSGEEDNLWRQHVPNPRSLLRLASNPFMFTMLFLVQWTEGELPKNRGDLFGHFTDTLLKRERLAETESKRLLAGLADLAWRMQTDRVAAGQSGDGEFGVLTVVSRAAAVEALASEELLKKAQDSTLLEGGDELRFRHQLLQEYFTARALRGNIDKNKIRAENLWPPERWWQRTGWEETAVLLAGFYADDCSDIVRWLATAQPEVAARCIQESGAEIANRSALLGELQSAWLPRLTDIEREPAPEARAAIGRALGRLGLDCRKGVGLRHDGLPDIDWVEIPGGEFIYQEGERRKLETFGIARYPVTNIQFQAFLDAKDGYADNRWWKRLSDPDRSPRPAEWGESNHPRETVSWHEATAFCAWLGHNLNRDVRLPAEWQWERAARGRDGRIYPWGNEYISGYANTWETPRLARASAVGIYPHGASPEGVLDLSGNVWEWCLNEYANPDRTEPEGTESRVLRGGSWDDNRGYACAAYRLSFHPDFRDDHLGFRVVASPIAG